MASMDPVTMEVKRITGPEGRQIYYYAHDGYAHEYIFDYDSGSLKEIYRQIDGLKNVEHNYEFSYFIDYPDLNKLLCIKPKEKLLLGLLTDNYYSPIAKRGDAIGYAEYIEDINILDR